VKILAGIAKQSEISKQVNEFPKYSFNLKKSETIGVVNPCYGYERVSYSLRNTGFVFTRIAAFPLNKLIKKQSNYLDYTQITFDFVAPCKLLHTWNLIPVSSRPFVVSFECELPRYFGKITQTQLEFGFRTLASDKCKKILALSDAAANFFAKSCTTNGYPQLIEKLVTFRGGVSLPLPPKENYQLDEKLKLIFVGTSAFRKGIVPIFLACESLINKGINLELTIVGSMETSCYVYREFIPDKDAFEAKFESCNWINFLGKQPPSRVYELIRESHLMLFPSLDESLGWIPIEAALLGVPSVTTDIFALPELVEHDNTGYLISIEKNWDRRFIGLSKVGKEKQEELIKAENIIENGIVDAVERILKEPSKLETWGKNAYSKAQSMYGTDAANAKLRKIYTQALS
jgi:glycosyltransferase involved in cell wall biosynthesis